MKKTKLILYFFLLWSLSFAVHAAPEINLCTNESCRETRVIQISSQVWRQVKDLYSMPFASDIEEQDNLVTSIHLLETDIYSTIASKNPQLSSAQAAYTINSAKLNYRNLKRVIGLLMDQHLITRHYLRNTLTSDTWYGTSEISGLLIQSIQSADLYILKKDVSSIQTTASFTPYGEPSAISSTPKHDSTSTQIEDELE